MIKSHYFALLCWSTFIFSLSSLAETRSISPTSTAVNHFQQALEKYIESDVLPNTPGFAITVVIGGKPRLTKAYGIRKTGTKETVNTDTVFRLASVSKTFTSAAVGTLVQNGQLQWDYKLVSALKNLTFKNPAYTRQLTLRHLLSHTTGLVPHAYTNLLEDNLSYEQIIKRMNRAPFVCAPGNCYGYQNIAYSLAGNVVATVSQDSFEKVVKKNLFEPLHMTHSSYGLKAFVGNPNRGIPHVWSQKHKQWLPAKTNSSYYKVAPAAGVNASINDMRQWLMAQLGYHQEVLSAAILDSMHSKQVKTSRRQAHYVADGWQGLEGVYYGLGWRVFDFGGVKNFIHHGGWVKGFRSEMLLNTELQMGMVILTNSETRFASEIVPRFLQLYSDYIPSTKQP